MLSGLVPNGYHAKDVDKYLNCSGASIMKKTNFLVKKRIQMINPFRLCVTKEKKLCILSPAAVFNYWACFFCFFFNFLSCQDGGLLPGASQLLCHS